MSNNPKNVPDLLNTVSGSKVKVNRGNGKVRLQAPGHRSFIVSDHKRPFDPQTANKLRNWLIAVGVITLIVLLPVLFRSFFTWLFI